MSATARAADGGHRAQRHLVPKIARLSSRIASAPPDDANTLSGRAAGHALNRERHLTSTVSPPDRPPKR
jgi:hypothetical protein